MKPALVKLEPCHLCVAFAAKDASDDGLSDISALVWRLHLKDIHGIVP